MKTDNTEVPVGTDCMCPLGSTKHQIDCEYYEGVELDKVVEDMSIAWFNDRYTRKEFKKLLTKTLTKHAEYESKESYAQGFNEGATHERKALNAAHLETLQHVGMMIHGTDSELEEYINLEITKLIE